MLKLGYFENVHLKCTPAPFLDFYICHCFFAIGICLYICHTISLDL